VDTMTFIMDYAKVVGNNLESMLMINASKAFNDMLENGIQYPDFADKLFKDDGSIHNEGILKYISRFKTVKAA